MNPKTLYEFRTWATAVGEGGAYPPANEIRRIVYELLDEIENLHNRYAHEGGRPQILTMDILIEWVQALDVPTMENIYPERHIVNVFTADFSAPLEARHIRQMEALELRVIDTEYPQVGRGRYMLKWKPPAADEDG